MAATPVAGTNLLTRADVARSLCIEGFDVSERTIRYWEGVGLLPKAVRHGRSVVHTPDVLGRARLLAATRPSVITRIRRSGGTGTTRPRSHVEAEITPTGIILRVRFSKPERLAREKGTENGKA